MLPNLRLYLEMRAYHADFTTHTKATLPPLLPDAQPIPDQIA